MLRAMAEIDAATGLPVDLLPYRPDTSVYDSQLRDQGPPPWLDEIDLRPAPPRQRVGTHSTTTDRWLCADEARPMELALRSRLIDERRDVVFRCAPHADDAAATTLELVLAWLDDQGIDHPAPDRAEHPLVAAGRLVQEDLCLMVRRDGAWHLDAGLLCFPTLWRLDDRFGLPTPTVHEHIPHYAEIETRVDRFFDRLVPERVVWRRNFSVKPYPHLFVPTSKTEMPVGVHHVATDGDPYWIRSERQTLRRLVAHDAIVFAIRVQVVRARALLARPHLAAAMAEHLRSWDEPTRRYKFAGSDQFDAFVGWLDRVAAPDTHPGGQGRS